MTVYLDIVLIENIAMNYIILLTVAIINKGKIKKIKLFISSIIGGIYAVFSFWANLEIYTGVFFKIFLSIVMAYIAFSPKTIKGLFKELVLFYMVSFAFGGTALAVLYFIKPQDMLTKNGILIGTYPIKIIILGAILGFFIINTAIKSIKNRINRNDIFCNIDVEIENKILKVRGILDTGNFLKEPLTGIPVIIIENNELKKILPIELINNAENIINGDIKDVNDKYVKRLRVIPFTSLGKQNGILLGIKADRVNVELNEKNYLIEQVIIGMYNKNLTNNGVYNALIGIDILEGGTNEFIADAKT